MFLRSIKLRGFKSFPDQVEVLLEPGVAVVVGPNGSGKSNIADGVVWAAGSLAPSALRAEKPEDVLFGGSTGRPPVEHCEVELVFDNSAGDGPLPYTELAIARRAQRGGESQYLVNRAPVRRTDIVELLGDAGLGHEMHAVVGQGRVEQILSSKPAERRALIEEAAGLGGFKQRRHRAELKLARVGVQVDRAKALEAEARKRLRPLALQATAAQRAERLRDEVVRIRSMLGAAELARLDGSLEQLAARRGEAELERRRRDERLEGALTERREAEEQLEQAAGRHEHATAALYRLRSAVERLELRWEAAETLAGTLRENAERARRLADAPREQTELEQLAAGERALAEAAQAARAALEERDRLEMAARLAAERLDVLNRSLAEREGLPPAARALADAGEPLALAVLDVEPGYERAVAAALSFRAAAVLAEDAAAALALAERARSEGLGPICVLVPAQAAASAPAPVRGAEPLGAHVRALPGGERVAEVLAEVWVVELSELLRVAQGIAVTRKGHGFDPGRGELWFSGVAAESVLIELHARSRLLAGEVESVRAAAAAAADRMNHALEVEREAQERVTSARAAVALMPPTVEPAEAERLERKAGASERLRALLEGAAEAGGRFEAPLRARVDAGGASSARLGEELRRLGALESELRQAAAEAAQRVSALEVEQARLQTERADLARRLPEGTAGAEISEVELPELESTLARLERRLETIGPINPLAAEELEREKEAVAQLTEQREDLERSLAELDRLRRELTETVERRFEETYAAVERHFADVAGTLFPGGEGRLRLTMPEGEDDGQEPGVEVELRPAGKKVTRLSLLSGGEKALGALSFLFALFLARPCPVYFLDEVEAALDDTNIGRFVDLLRRYADRAQFVVITHQKRTMEAADILYGVTMGSDGVSQVVSKRLRPGSAVEAA